MGSGRRELRPNNLVLVRKDHPRVLDNQPPPGGNVEETHNSENEQPNELVGSSPGELGVGIRPHRGKKVDKGIGNLGTLQQGRSSGTGIRSLWPTSPRLLPKLQRQETGSDIGNSGQHGLYGPNPAHTRKIPRLLLPFLLALPKL